MVYIMNAQTCLSGPELISLREHTIHSNHSLKSLDTNLWVGS